MVDNEKQDNLANARRKLKKFRDQQQPNGNNHSTLNYETNGINLHSLNGTSPESVINSNNIPQNLTDFVSEQQGILNGIHQNLSKSPVTELEEQNRQYALLIENQKQQRTRLEDQRQFGSGSSMSGRLSQTQSDIDSPRHVEQKYRRDVEHLQEQLGIHVQTIGILVAEKTDISAKLSQSFKQLERKQGEMDELYGRLKASRERVQELEKIMQNSTSNVQKREMAAKESDKENDRLKIENIRHSQSIEDLKQIINELNNKLNNRQNIIEQLTNDTEQLKNQSVDDSSLPEKYQQQINELQQTISLKNNHTDELLSSINQMRSDNEQMQLQYQQYNTNMQNHVQELNNQINQLVQTNQTLQTENEAIRKNYGISTNHLIDNNLIVERDSLQQENQLFRNAIDQWSNRYEEIRIEKEQIAKLLIEKDEYITKFKENIPQIKDSNEKVDVHEQETQTISSENELHEQVTTNNDDNDSQQKLIERFNRAMHENADLKDRTQHLEHVILQLQSETETIGDYIYLYQQQREQLQRRYQEKDDYITQLTQDRFNLQKKLSELEILIIHCLNKPVTNRNQLQESNNEISMEQENTQKQSITDENERLETNNNALSSSSTHQTTSLPQLNDETKARILALIKELGQSNFSSSQTDNLSTVKLAFVDKNFYICSTCSGPVQWV